MGKLFVNEIARWYMRNKICGHLHSTAWWSESQPLKYLFLLASAHCFKKEDMKLDKFCISARGKAKQVSRQKLDSSLI
jgi:hypothetical protein